MTTPRQPTERSAWYHQPIAWFGLAVFVASVAGCVWIIISSIRYADHPVDPHQATTTLGIPVAASSSRPPRP